MTSAILYLAGFIFLAFTYVYLTSYAVSVGLRAGLTLFVADMLPAMMMAQAANSKSSDKTDAIMDVLEAEDRGEISPENAQIILRNIRGEKD